MLKSLNKNFAKFKTNHSKSVNCSYTQRFKIYKVSPASTVMSGKFGFGSGKSQGNVREFCFVKSV